VFYLQKCVCERESERECRSYKSVYVFSCVNVSVNLRDIDSLNVVCLKECVSKRESVCV